MQPRDLPSLTALAAFEAAARHLSFKHAADELNVTAPAVSRQIRALETALLTALFVRAHRQVELTAEGHALFDSVSRAFKSMAESAREISSPGAQQVRVGSTNAVATYWLMPRLADFWRRHPDVNFHHVVSDQTINLAATRVDVAVRFGLGEWAGLDSHLLFSDRIYPVCSPGFAETLGDHVGLEVLASASLLDVGDVREEGWLGWSDWFRGEGSILAPRKPRCFNSYVVAVQAAIDGLGVVLGWHSLVGEAVADGRLVAVSGHVLDAPGGFYLVARQGEPVSHGARLFMDWLMTQAETYRLTHKKSAGT